MFPPEIKKIEYEKAPINMLLTTTIEEIEYQDNRSFKGFKGNADTICPAVRFKFSIEGLQYPKYSRWMKFSIFEKSNLYSKYLSKIVSGMKPDQKFDLDHLIGFKVKTMWTDNGDFQNLEVIIPDTKPFPYTDKPYDPNAVVKTTPSKKEPPVSDEEVPF